MTTAFPFLQTWNKNWGCSTFTWIERNIFLRMQKAGEVIIRRISSNNRQ